MVHQNNVSSTRNPRLGRIVNIVGGILLGALFLASGTFKVSDPAASGAQFVTWGYPAWFALVIGSAEIAGGLLLFVPRTRGPAALALAAIMLGAIGTHARLGEWGLIALPALLALGSAALAGPYVRRVARQRAQATPTPAE